MAKRPIPQNRVRELRQERGWSMQKLGELLGKDASYINKIEKLSQAITSATLVKLAQAFGVDTSAILTETATDDNGQIIAQPRQDPASMTMPQIPVLGTAAGSHIRGASQLLDGPVDYVDAPKALWNAKDLYAIYVVGDSMSPMFRHGAFCIIAPHKPVRVGDAVIVEEKKGEHASSEATLGILEKMTADTIILKKLNPPAEVKLNAKYTTRIHRVLETADLFGLS